MQLTTSKAARYVTPLLVSFITITVFTFWLSEARAYEKYSGCKDCHGSFRGGQYTSLSDGSRWSDNLHDVHRNDMLGGDCDACHVSGDKGTVFMDRSKGGEGLTAISCVGCHGREEDIGHDSVSVGRGAGLRQQHTNAGQMDCQDCHSDAVPANYTPAGEDVLPNYFANPGTNHPSMPTNSCNPIGNENFEGTTLGLNNDGDGSYATADSDCIATFTVGGNVSGLVGSDLALQNNGTDTLVVTTDGPFTFATELEEGGAYTVTVSAQPTDQTCSVTNGSGSVANVSITNVVVGCTTTFIIDAGLNDAWYDPETDGQGFFITVFPDLDAVLLAWFTYDTELPSEDATANLGDPGHRWLTAVGPITGNQAVMQIEMTSGGIFDTPTEIQRTDPPGSDGSIILTFDNCNSGTVEYDITSINQKGIVPIQRVAKDNIVLCEALKAE